jgi:hypothetical protein
MSQQFDAEKVERGFQNELGEFQPSDSPLNQEVVAASDYDKLLELYRALQAKLEAMDAECLIGCINSTRVKEAGLAASPATEGEDK